MLQSEKSLIYRLLIVSFAHGVLCSQMLSPHVPVSFDFEAELEDVVRKEVERSGEEFDEDAYATARAAVTL